MTMAPPTRATNNKDFNRMATSMAGIRRPSLVEIRRMGPPVQRPTVTASRWDCSADARDDQKVGCGASMTLFFILHLDLIVDAT
jgi:hypothetical protein